MRKFRVGKLAAVVAGAALLTGAGSVAAFADTTAKPFDATLPAAQQQAYTGYQTKTTSSKAGKINVSSVGSSYKVNAKMGNSANAFGTEVKGLGDGYSAPLDNSFKSGTSVRMALTDDTWTYVTVQASGTWVSN